MAAVATAAATAVATAAEMAAEVMEAARVAVAREVVAKEAGKEAVTVAVERVAAKAAEMAEVVKVGARVEEATEEATAGICIEDLWYALCALRIFHRDEAFRKVRIYLSSRQQLPPPNCRHLDHRQAWQASPRRPSSRRNQCHESSRVRHQRDR